MDLYADPPGTRIEQAEKFSSALGGSAANIAAAIVRLGGTAALITAVSDDAVGRFIRNQLRHYGVDTSYVTTTGGEARSSLAVVETRSEDCQSVIYRNGAADFALTDGHVAKIAYGDFGCLVVTGTSLAMEPSRGATFRAMALARAGGRRGRSRRGLPALFLGRAQLKPARSALRAATLSDIVIGNDVEFAVMAGEHDGLDLARDLAADGARIAVYKMGEKGSVTFCDGQSFETGIYAVTALKPTGAGDAFMGGLLTASLPGWTSKQPCGAGSAAAAIVVTRVGCAPAMPNSCRIASFIAGYPART